jgi:hypothetical protein
LITSREEHWIGSHPHTNSASPWIPSAT